MILQHAKAHTTRYTTTRDSLTDAQRVIANQIRNIPASYVGYVKFGSIWCYVTDELDVIYMFLAGEWERVTDVRVAARILA